MNGAGATLVSFAYTLAPTGNRTKIVEHDGITRNYAYDHLYRLTDEHVKQGTAPDAPTAWRNQFAHDPVGNRLEQLRQTENGTPQPVIYTYDDRDRLLTENGISGLVTYGWDANGNQTAKSGTDGATYTWDIENRLVRVELVGGTVVEHSYDADGTRIRTRTTPSVGLPATVDYLVDPWHQTSARGALILSQVVAETDEANALAAYHARGDDLLATLRPESGSPVNLIAHYFHSEAIGSIRALSGELGEVSDRFTFEAFGTLLDHQGNDANTDLFAGEPLDPNSRFSNNRARWLDSGTGRFVGMDQLYLADPESGQLHRYLYASADPVHHRDPTGLYEGFAGVLASASISGIVNGMISGAISYAFNRNFEQSMLAVSEGFFWGFALGALGGLIGKAAAASRVLTTAEKARTGQAAVARVLKG